MRSTRLPLLLNIVGVLLSVSGGILRINHSISLALFFAMVTLGMLAISQARRLQKTLP